MLFRSIAINKEDKKELQKQQKNFQQIETQLATLQVEKKALENLLADPSIYAEKTKYKDTEVAIKKVDAQIDDLNTQYESTFEKIVELESKK